MTKSAGLPPKVPSYSSHVITLKEKKCTCCLLLPIGTNMSPGHSSSEPPCISSLVSDLVQMGVVNRPNISFYASHTSKNSNCDARWEEWVKKMSCNGKFVSIWCDAGIHDAIVVASVSADIKIDQKAMEALFGFWCPDTNTFTFPWGEATLTPEDAHVLTGLPLGGSELDRKLTKGEEKLQMRLILEMKKMLELNDIDGTITCDVWLEWFMNTKDIDDELMHLGFLTYWLSKEVFPSQDPAQDAAFGLAARLSLGEKVALAPCLVADIYHNLNSMTESHLCFQGKKARRRGEHLKAWAPFSILQCWIWERFKCLCPSLQSTTPQQSRTRITRWSGRQSRHTYDDAMEVFKDETQFTWRPYCRRLGQWSKPEWYSMESQNIIIGGRTTPIYAHDFLTVISCAQLKGICEDGYVFLESYCPNRVARQFGFDQAIPEVSRTCGQSSLHKPSTKKIQLFIPGITRCGNPRDDYTKWWRSFRARYDDILKAFGTEKIDNIISKKRKAKEISKIGFTEKVAIGCKHQQINDTSNTDGLNRPLYSSLQLLYDKGSDTVDATVGPTSEIITDDDDDDDVLVMYYVQPPEFCEKEKADSVHRDKLLLVSELKKLTNLGPEFCQKEKGDSVHKDEHLLVEELKKFQSLGLMTWHEVGPYADRSTEASSSELKDLYGQEAIDHYPQFFRLIPQRPHYRGILERRTIDEDLKSDILLGQWYLLVNLMGEALKTNDQSDPKEIERMMKMARNLERLGFDVRHLIARLKTVQKGKHLK